MWYKFAYLSLFLVAKEKRDPLALHLFYSAGFQLGKHIKALLPKTEPVRSVVNYSCCCHRPYFSFLMWAYQAGISHQSTLILGPPGFQCKPPAFFMCNIEKGEVMGTKLPLNFHIKNIGNKLWGHGLL